MKTTPGIRRIIDDAVARGYHVTETSQNCMIRTGKTARSVGLVIWETGHAYRSDVRLDHCVTIRSQKVMRSILGID